MTFTLQTHLIDLPRMIAVDRSRLPALEAMKLPEGNYLAKIEEMRWIEIRPGRNQI